MAFVTKEYACETCGEFEVSQKHTETFKRCPICDSIEIERIISCPAIAKMGGPRTIGALIDLNNSRNPLEREKTFGVGAEAKMKQDERLRKIQKMTPEQKHKFVIDGTI